MIITIDGPTATGKSTVARLLARKLGVMHLNSGLFFRALGYLLVTNHGYNEAQLQNPEQKDIAECLDMKRCIYRFNLVTGRASVFYDGRDITQFLMTKESDHNASLVGTSSLVHEAITKVVRTIGQGVDLVIDGRNAGSLIFPDAQIKFFLTASVDVRAERWRKHRGNGCSFEDARAYTTKRDERDVTRPVAPLRIPSDAYVIDTSNLDQDSVCDKMLAFIQGHIP